MTDDIRKSFESLLKKGEYAEAEKQLNEFIEQHPEDREAKMLFGTCRMLQGDTEIARPVKESRNKQGESLFHVIVSVFVYFLFYPLILFVFVPSFGIICLPPLVLYSILTIIRFREKNDNAD